MTTLSNIAGPNKGAKVCQTPMACSIPQMVTYLIRGALIHRGLPEDDAKRVTLTDATEGHPAIASLRVLDRYGQEREVIRIEDEAHLNRVVNEANTCDRLVREVRAVLEA